MKQILFLLIGLLLPEVAGAEDIKISIDGFIFSFSINQDKRTAQLESVEAEWGHSQENLVIPSSFEHEGATYSVTSIGSYACGNLYKTTSLTIPNSVTYIGDHAFYAMEKLTSVHLGNSIETIADYAFLQCKSLPSIDLPESLKTLGCGVFQVCTALTSLYIPANVSSIKACTGVGAGCSKLESIVVDANNAYYDSRDGCNAIIEKQYNTLIAGCKNTVIPNGVESIGGSAFRSCTKLSSIEIPDGVTGIGRDAFKSCTSLSSVILPNTLTRISDYAFESCTKLTSLTIPENTSLTNGNAILINGNAFLKCTNLTSLTMMSRNPETVIISNTDGITNRANITLYVPGGTKARYEAKWGGVFKEIVEMESLSELELAVQYLQAKQVIDGTTLADAQPDDDVLRAQIAKMAFRGVYSTGSNEVPTAVPSDNFPTVYEDLATKTEANAYYYQAAKALLYLEYGDGVTPFDRNRLSFSPTEKMARIHVLKVLMETFNLQPAQNGYVQQAADLGIITTDTETFRPADYCTRGEAFLMLYRIMKAVDEGRITAPIPVTTDYFEPLNTTLATISLGTSLSMGNFQHYTKTSFALSGVVPLAFSHTYNSYNTTLPEVFYGARAADETGDTYQPLGDGWSHNYHSFVTVVNTDNGLRAIVHWGGGSIDVYKSEEGKIVPVSLGVYDDFTLDGDDAVIKSKSQMTYRFSRQGSTGAAVLYLSSVTDRNGNTLTLNYEQGVNGAMRIGTVSDGLRSLTFSYKHGTNLVESVSDPLGRSIGFAYFLNTATGHYQLSSFTDAKGQMTTYVYGDASKASTSKLLSRIQLPKGNYIENEYDANCRLKKTESGADGVPTMQTSIQVATNYGLGTASTQSALTVQRGTQTSTYNYSFNENNVTTAMTGAKGLYANYTYGNDAHPQLPTAMQNNSTEVNGITYDTKGNVTSITVKGDGTLTSHYAYDAMNNLTSTTDPKGNKTTYTYDTKGNLTKVTAPEGVKWEYTVDDKGLPTVIKSPMDVKTEYEYNDYGNLVKTTLPALGLSGTAVYDAASRLISSTDALNRTRKFAYDANDNLTVSTDPAGHETINDYDQNDNLTAVTNAKGGVTTMTYDYATDWLLSVEFAGAKKQYAYNQDGTLSTFTKPDGTVLSYSYDDLGRITNDGMNSYSYDTQLHLSQISGERQDIGFTYDGFNRIKKVDYDGRQNYSNTYTYDANGNCTSINGTVYGYDGLNRLTSVTFNDKTISYAYRKDSRLDKVTYPNGMTTTYGYDAVGRLTSKQTKLANGTVIAAYGYTLDKAGNIVEQTTKEPYDEMLLATEDVSYSYNDGNRITKAGDITFTFDKNGNTTQRGSEQYQWVSKRDRLTKAGSTSLTYDPLGLIASYGNTTFTTDPLGIGSVLSDSEGSTYIYGNGLEARVKGGKVSYYVTDVRGSVVAIVDDNGNVTHRYQYDEFGKVVQKQEADYNPFQYVGKYGVMVLNDHLYYMRARHYDPTIGRFLSEDPIWSTNLYPYADNNPVMGIDPRGEMYDYNPEKDLHFYINGGTLVACYNGNTKISCGWKLGDGNEKFNEYLSVVNLATKKYQLVYNEDWKDKKEDWRKGGVYIYDREAKKAVIVDVSLFNNFDNVVDAESNKDFVIIKRNRLQDASLDERAINILRNNYSRYLMYGSESDYVDMKLITFYEDFNN